MSPVQASNRLYRGEVKSFDEAMDIHIYCVQNEIGLCAQTDEFEVKIAKSLENSLERAKRARRIWALEVEKAALAAVAKMREAGLDEFAEPLETGDYSVLAI